MSGVAQTSQFLGQSGQVQHQSTRLQRLQGSLTQYWVKFARLTLSAQCDWPEGRYDNSLIHDNLTNLLQYFLLSPNVERIFAGEQSGPGGGADLLTVGLVQPHTPLGQSLHGGGGHVRVVPGHVVPPEVVSQDENNIRLLSLSSNTLGETAENEAETLHRDETRLFMWRRESEGEGHTAVQSLCYHHADIAPPTGHWARVLLTDKTGSENPRPTLALDSGGPARPRNFPDQRSL